MIFKFAIFAVFIAVINAGVLAVPVNYSAHMATPLVARIATPIVAKAVVVEAYDHHPQYTYGYSVQDELTGDSKTHYEQRDGDVVHGQYTVIDADGFHRIVEYTADAINGFNAIVHREPLAVKSVAPIVSKVTGSMAYAAPIAKVAAPVAHSASIYYH